MMKIMESAENYLEAILMLGQNQEFVRSIDVANKLGFSKPSVSFAMKKLRENGYIIMEDNGHLILTASGREIAEDILERHQVLTAFLMDMGVDSQTAHEDACRMEHVISALSFDKIKEHIDKHHRK